MATIVEGLMAATDAMRDAVAQVLAVRDDALARVTALINTFRTAANVTYWCDPINGSDTSDGLTINTPKKSFDGILASAGGMTTVSIVLLNDAIVSNRSFLFCPLIINGVIKDNSATGYSPYKRKLTFLGTAANSPVPLFGTTCAGIAMYGPSVRLSNVDVLLGDMPSGQAFRNAITAFNGLAVSADSLTLTVATSTTGSLFGVVQGRITASLNLALGTNAAGHVFDGIAAGGNPNNMFAYATNVTSG